MLLFENIEKIKDLLKKFNFLLTKKQKKMSVYILILTLFGSLAETLGVSAIFPMMQVIIYGNEKESNSFIFEVFNKIGITEYKERLVYTIVALIFMFAVKNIFMSGLTVVRAKYSMDINKGLTVRMIRSYIGRGYSFLKDINTSELLRGCTEAGNAIQIAVYNILKMVAEIVTLVLILIIFAITDIRLVAFLIVVMLICVGIVLGLFKNRTRTAGNESYIFLAEATKWMLQLFEGVKEVLVMRKDEYFIKKYSESYSRKLRAMTRQTIYTELPAFIIEAICVGGVMICIGWRLFSMDNPIDYVPIMAVFAMGVFRIMPSLGRITSHINVILYHIPPVNDAYTNILNEKPSICAGELEQNIGEPTYSYINTISLQNVCFKYPDAEKEIIKELSLVVNKGESVGIVGESGAGKTTLSDIILGLVKPDVGEVLVDDKSIFANLEFWASIIGYVPQNIYLLDDTVRRNIALGVEDEYIDEEKVRAALDKAQILEYVEELPKGIDTVIGERGVRFSGGQAQRLAIARALYNDPEILIFDEATSALDSETEKAVMDAINSLHGEKTMIIIAHRLSTISNCDAIYEISNGKAYVRKYEELSNKA